MNQAVHNQFDAFMSVRQVSSYLQLNEKKIYALISEGSIPATKITGKWMFPRELIDKWMLDSTHNGVLHDRLLIAGSDDPLLHRIVMSTSESLTAKALVNYCPTSARAGLKLLNAGKVDGCCLHWGPLAESRRRHPSLLQQYSAHHGWVLIRLFEREQGIFFNPQRFDTVPEIPAVFDPAFRWALRQEGSGSQRFLMEILSKHGLNADLLNHSATALSEREAAAAVSLNQADIGFGSRATANEFRLDFISLGWEAFDLVIRRDIWFRRLFQSLLNHLRSDMGQQKANLLGGYGLEQCGELMWGDD